MNNKKIYVCEDSIDGIFTAIYTAWSSGYGHANIKLETKSNHDNNFSNFELFADYITVETDYDLSSKVAKSMKEKISTEAFEMACRVALSEEPDKADLIYRFLIIGFATGAAILNHLSNEVVNNVFKINKYVNNEAHHLLGFIRFSEQESGLLTSIIHPRNNVLSIVAPHFADRLPMEHFAIYDENRNIAALHMPWKPWVMVEVEDILTNRFGEFTHEEEEYRKLWKIFFHSIEIKERINPKLQRNNLPLRFRGDMIEFR